MSAAGRRITRVNDGSPLRAGAGPGIVVPVSPSQVLLWCAALILLEINHLKWIWWEHWSCGKCGRKHKDCACSSKWIMYL